jgi:hypothetical protein
MHHSAAEGPRFEQAVAPRRCHLLVALAPLALLAAMGCGAEADAEGELGEVSEALTLSSGVRPTSIALDGSNAYFTNSFSPTNELDQVPLAGGALTIRATTTAIMTSVVRLGSTLYWANIAHIGSAGGAWKINTAGGSAVQISSHDNDLVSPQALLAYTTGSGITKTTHVLFGNALAAKLYDTRISTFGTSEKSLLPDVDPVTMHNYYPFTLVRDAASVYFLHDSGGGVFKAPLSGGAATKLVSPAEPKPLAIAGTTLFFMQGSDIKQVSSSGGAVTSFASAGGTVTAMAVSSGSLYWTCSSCGNVVKKPLGGGAKTVLASGQTSPSAIAVDATHVYFGTSNALKRVLK